MPRRTVRLKSQHPTFLSERPIWARRLVHIVLLFGTSVLVANALVGKNGLVDTLEARHRHRVLVDDVNRLRLENERLRLRARSLIDCVRTRVRLRKWLEGNSV